MKQTGCFSDEEPKASVSCDLNFFGESGKPRFPSFLYLHFALSLRHFHPITVVEVSVKLFVQRESENICCSDDDSHSMRNSSKSRNNSQYTVAIEAHRDKNNQIANNLSI